MTVFVIISSQESEVHLPTFATEPDLDIVGFETHLKGDKVYSLSLRQRTWPDLVEGSPLTIIFGE